MIPDSFSLVSVTDTCAIWNLVGSATLFRAARQKHLSFIITDTVSYECFVKTRGSAPSVEHQRLRQRLAKHIEQSDVSRFEVTIDDLQDVINAARQQGSDRRLGYGEMSCAALARRLRHAVLTDNKRDFKAIEVLVDGLLQTTPRLLRWLYLVGRLTDGDVKDVIKEHCNSGGHMSPIYERAHREACERRLVRQLSK